MTAADIAAAVGDARREGRGWRSRYPLHGGRGLTLRDGDGGPLPVWCFGGCDPLSMYSPKDRRGLRKGQTQRLAEGSRP
jgi:putative DNA primase/helicase